MRFWGDGDGDDWSGEGNILQRNGGVFGAEGVAGDGIRKPDESADFTREESVDDLLMIRMHSEDAADTLLLLLGGVVDICSGFQLARIDAHIDQFAYRIVADDLESQRGRRRIVVGGAFHGGAVRRGAGGGGEVEGAGEVVHHRVEQSADALVAEGGSAENGEDLLLMGALANGGDEFVFGNGFVGEVLVHQRVVEFGGGLNETLAPLLGVVAIFLGERLVHGIGSLLVLDVAHLAHFDQIDDAVEVGTLVHWDANRHRIGT